MRVAIDRILKQPTLVGINTPKLRGTAPVERIQTPMAVRGSTRARLASKVQSSKVFAGNTRSCLDL